MASARGDDAGPAQDRPAPAAYSAHRHSNAHLSAGGGAGAASNHHLADEFQTTTLTRRRGTDGSGRGRSPASIEAELSTSQHLHHASVHGVSSSGGSGGAHHLPRTHELRRPDSVITTTSSIVSSDTASQAGDSSNEGSGGGGNHASNSVYAISGLYGNRGSGASNSGNAQSSSASSSHPMSVPASAKETQASSMSSSSEAGSSLTSSSTGNSGAASASSPADFNLISKVPPTSSAAAAAMSIPQGIMHRRQGSHPVQGTQYGSSAPATTSTASGASKWGAPSAGAMPTALPSTVVARVNQGHRRSNSYGHHRALTNSASLGAGVPANAASALYGHRRTGSSVIETLQTLTCAGGNGANGAEGEKTREETIAQFLENLKKEQQEK